MREKFLFIFVGMLIGLFVGFVFAGSIQQRPAQQARTTQQSTMPPMVADVLDKARNNPGNFEAQVRAAQLYYEIQRYDDAIGYLLKANQIQPDHFETIANLGTVILEADHSEEAAKWFELAISKQPDNVSVLESYGALLLKQKNFNAAAMAISRLETLDPSNPDLPQLRKALKELQ